MKQSLLLILMCISASVLFGILHNQVSARVSIEYFTVGHARLISSTSPTLMGIAWGIYSTWWVGLIMGSLFSLAGRLGSWPKRNATFFFRPIAILFISCACASLIAGLAGYWLADRGSIAFIHGMGDVIDIERQPFFTAALWMHTASYTTAAMGSLVIAVLSFLRRVRQSQLRQIP